MTYNLLSEELQRENSYLYSRCPAHVLPWHYRIGVILSEIERYTPDVMCLQELDQSRWDDVQSSLCALGYDGFFSARTGAKPDGCALFWCDPPGVPLAGKLTGLMIQHLVTYCGLSYSTVAPLQYRHAQEDGFAASNWDRGPCDEGLESERQHSPSSVLSFQE